MNFLTPLDTTWLLFSAFLVMLMQAGFCLFEAGLVRSKNNINVAFKNLSDFAVCAFAFWLVGYGVMYGSSAGGFIGTSQFLFNPDDGNGAWFLFQLMFCGATATIVGGALAERTGFSTYLSISLIIGALIYPVAGHWVWSGASKVVATDATQGWLVQLGFMDFAGGSVVHLLGGCLALVAVIIVGPRLGRFPAEGSDPSTHKPINASNYPMATVGVMLLWFGWFGFNTGSSIGYSSGLASIAINTALAAAVGSVTLILYFLIRTGKPEISAALNGTLAGLVGVTAGANVFSTTDAVLVGVVSALCMQFASTMLEKYKIDDVVGAFPVHAVAGMVGLLFVAVLGNVEAFPLGHSRVEQFGIQLIGIVAIAAWSLGVGYAILYALNKIHPMRVSVTDEFQGLNFAEHNATTEVQDLLGSMVKQSKQGDFTGAVDVEPHTEVGQIAQEYNNVLDRIRLEIQTREEAYEQLKEASHFQYIFENSNEGIVQFSMKGEVQKANKAAASILGYASKDRLSDSLNGFMKHHSFSQEGGHQELVDQLKQQGQVVSKEIRYTRESDGKSGVAMCTMRSVSGDGETAPCILASFSDLGERIENEKLKLANKAAEASNIAKSQFLANMSHEIRTPLNGVTGMLELLNRTDLEKDQERYIQIAQNSAKSLLSVINDILDFSKIEAGKLELERVEFPLRETLADVVDIFASQTASKSVELIGNIPMDLPEWVIGDPERLRQVFINILGNAVKFTESGSISLSASCTKRDDKAAVIRISVKDSGCGISEENLSKLFESFTQADSTTTREYGGTGLGLTISRQLIELMKGRITVTSKLGEGSDFIIELVLPVSDRISSSNKKLPESLSGMRVLVVDDHPVNLELTEKLLKPFGLQIDTAQCAQAAMELHNKAVERNRPYELFLLDYHMPKVDGLALANRLRQTGAGRNAKLILLTSIDQVRPQDEGMSNFNTLLVKPVRASRLFDSIATVMGDRVLKQSWVDVHESGNSAPPAMVPKAVAAKTRIMLVEDNMVNQIVASEILEQAGYVIETAENGQEAVDKLTDKFDLILMDCQMPVLDGFGASQKIREIEKANSVTQSIPIIALTANALKGDRERCLAAGMNDYITKPIDPEELYALLAKYVGGGAEGLDRTGT